MTQYDVELMPDGTTSSPDQNVTCKYSDYQSSQALCEVWCEIQELKGFNCVMCPEDYRRDIESEELCNLWEQLVHSENDPDSSKPTNLTVTNCPHENSISSAKLCNLWCQVKSYEGFSCCPSEYLGDTEEAKLCELWNELQILDVIAEEDYDYNADDNSTQVPVNCIYENNSSGEQLCDLWCQNILEFAAH